MTYSDVAAGTLMNSAPAPDVDFPIEVDLKELPMTPAAAD